MTKTHRRTIPACRCDEAGSYCARHLCYGRKGRPTLPDDHHGRPQPDRDHDDIMERQTYGCGGGRRVIRKKISD